MSKRAAHRGGSRWRRIAGLTVLVLAATLSVNDLAVVGARAAAGDSSDVVSGVLPGQRGGSAANLSHVASSADTSMGLPSGPAVPTGSAGSVVATPVGNPLGPLSVVTDPLNATSTGVLGGPASVGGSGRGFDPARSVQLAVTSESTTTWVNPDGTQTAQEFTRPVHYQKPDGSWADIDNTLSADAAGVVHNGGGPTTLSLAAADATPVARLALADGNSVGFALAGASSVTPNLSGDTAHYPNVFANTDLSLRAITGGVKETLVLRNAAAARTFTVPLLLNGLVASLDASGAVFFTNLSGVREAFFPPGGMEDSATGPSGDGATSPGVHYSLSLLPAPVVTVTLDEAWLDDPARVYPVQVDPTAMSYHGGDDSWSYTNGPLVNSTADGLIKIGTYDGGSHVAEGFLHFPGVTSGTGNLNGDTIQSVNLGMFNNWSFSCNAREVYVHEITQSWNGSTAGSWPSTGASSLDSPAAQFAYGYSSNCPGNWSSISLGQPGVDLLNTWTHGAKANNGLEVDASATDSYGWKKFQTSNDGGGAPYLGINYTTYGVNYATSTSGTAPTNNTSGNQSFTLTNTGAKTWPANGNIRLAYHVYDGNNNLVQWDGTRTAIPRDVSPGTSVAVNATIGHLPPATYLIVWDMVDDGTAWFSDQYVNVAKQQMLVSNVPPVVTGTLPSSGVALYTLTPTLSLAGNDPDAWPGSLKYQMRVLDATGTVLIDSGWQNNSSYVVPVGVLTWGQQYNWQGQVGDGQFGSGFSGLSLFGVVVPQPPQSSRFGVDAAHGGADPASGNWSMAATDLTVPGAGIPLQLTRTYNSQDSRSGSAFGTGWSSVLDMQATDDGDGSGNVTVRLADGRTARFGRNPDGSFTGPPSLPSVLTTTTGAPKTYVLTVTGGTAYSFLATGKLSKITTPAGWAQTFTYAGSTVTISNSVSGRSVTVGFTNARVTTVTGPPPSASGLAPIWQYSYTNNALTSMCRPGVTAGVNCTNYTAGNATNHYPSSVLEAAPLAYWPLTDSAGTVAADAVLGNGSALAGVRTNTTTGGAGALTSTPRTSTAFNGSSSSVALPSNLYTNVNALAVELWFKTGAAGVLLSTQNSALGQTATNYDPILYVGADGKLRGEFYNGTGTPVTTASSVTDNIWHHVVLTGDGSIQTLYLDGISQGTVSGAVNWQANTVNTIGAGYISSYWPSTPQPAATSYFPGAVQEVALYTHPLSATTIAAHAAAGAGATVMSVVAGPGGVNAATVTVDAGSDRVSATSGAVGAWSNITAASAGSNQVTYQATDGQGNTFSWTNNAYGQVVSARDPLGTRSYSYDALAYSSSTTDENGHTTSVTRDASGAIASRTVCRVQGSTSCTTSYTSYDSHNVTVGATDPRYGKLVTSSDARSSGATDSTYQGSYSYDPNGNLTTFTSPVTTDFSGGRKTSYSYTVGSEAAYGGGTEPPGLLLSATTARGLVTTKQYYANGDLAQRTDPSGLVTTYRYDNAGHLASSQITYNSGKSSAVTTYSGYDAFNQVGTRTEPSVTDAVAAPTKTHTRITNYLYNPDGQLNTSTVSDGAGNDTARVTTYTYRFDGHLASVTDPTNATTSTTYDGNGHVLSVSTPRAETDYTYNARGEQTTATLKNYTGDPTNPSAAADLVLQSRAYDPAGRLASVTTDMGRTTKYTYWDDDLLATQSLTYRLSSGSRSIVLDSRSYDAAGHLIKQLTGNGKTEVRTVVDAAGRTSSSTVDPAGLNRTTTYSYDADDNTTAVVLSDASTTRTSTFAYDSGEQLSQQSRKNDATTNLITSFGHDERELLTTVTTPLGNASAAASSANTTTFTYDALGQRTSTASPAVLVESNGQTAVSQNLTALIGYDTFGGAAEGKDPNGNVTSSAFDGDGRPLTVTSAAYTRPSDGAVLTPAISSSYYPDGLLKTRTDARNNQSAFTYDQLGQLWRTQQPAASSGQTRPTWTYHPDYAGEHLSSTDPTGAVSSATFDDLGQMITRTSSERSPVANLTSTLGYDDAGNLTSLTSPLGVSASAAYDAARQRTSLKDATGDTTTFAYLIDGQLTTLTDPLGRVHQSTFDLAGRLSATKDYSPAPSSALLRTTSQLITDVNGNVTSSTDARGNTQQASFDALGAVLSTTRPVDATGHPILATFGYDANRNQTRRTDGLGNATLTSFTSHNLPESVTEPATTAYPAASDRTWTQSYDAASNPVSLTKPGAVISTRSYDNLNRFTTSTGSGAETATSNRTVSYDLTGRVNAFNAASGTQTVNYNDRGLLTGTAGPEGSATLSYNADGQLSGRTDLAGTTTFGYDSNARLLSAADPLTGATHTFAYNADSTLKSDSTGAGNDSRAYTYDNLGRLSTDALSSATGSVLAAVSYGRDSNNNVTSKDLTGGASAGHNAYSYDQANRLTGWTNPAGTAAGYGYDAADNRTSTSSAVSGAASPTSVTAVFDARHRLLSDSTGLANTYTARGTLRTSTPGGIGALAVTSSSDAEDRLLAEGAAVYSYDGLDRLTTRSSTTSASINTFSYADLSNAPVADSAESYTRTPAGVLLGLKAGPVAVATLTDQHGDLTGTYHPTAAALVDSKTFDPWGNGTASTGAAHDVGYQSGWTDPGSTKINMHARWYDPKQGSFTTRDSLTDPASGANTTNYAANNPLGATDPSGHSSEWWGGAVGVLGGAVADIGEVALATAEAGAIAGGAAAAAAVSPVFVAVVGVVVVANLVGTGWYLYHELNNSEATGSGRSSGCNNCGPHEYGPHPSWNVSHDPSGDDPNADPPNPPGKDWGAPPRGTGPDTSCRNCGPRNRYAPPAPPAPPVPPLIGPPPVVNLNTGILTNTIGLLARVYKPIVCIVVTCGGGNPSGNIGTGSTGPSEENQKPVPEPSADGARGGAKCPPGQTCTNKHKTCRSAAEDIVQLFRNVDAREFDAIADSGKFTTGEGMMEGKWFATSGEHAEQWGTKLNGGQGLTVETRVPRSVADQFHYEGGKLDCIGPGWYADGAGLDLINKFMDGIRAWS